MSEFLPTTTATFYSIFTPFDDYDTPESPEDDEVPMLTRVPIQITTEAVNQHQPAGNRGTTIKTLTARVRGHHALKLDYVIEDERTGVRYAIDNLDQTVNPVGDSCWFLRLRKIPTEAGQ